MTTESETPLAEAGSSLKGSLHLPKIFDFWLFVATVFLLKFMLNIMIEAAKNYIEAGVQSTGTAAWVFFWGLNSMSEHYTLDKVCIVIHEIASASNHKIKWWLSSQEAGLDSTNVIITNLITFSPTNLPSATIPSAWVEYSDGQHLWVLGSKNLNLLNELQVIK